MRIDLILNQHEMLGYEHPYIKYVLNIINDLKLNDYDEKDLEEYNLLIPENLSDAFKLHMEATFELNKTLLMVLIYHVLSNNSERTDLVAVTDFFINVTENVDDDLPQTVFDKMFAKILQELDNGGDIPLETLLRFNNFTVSTNYNLSKHIEDIIILLRNIIGSTNEIIVDLESGLGNNPKPGRVAFIILKSLTEKTFEDEDISSIFLLTLTTFCITETSFISIENIAVFFRQVLKKFNSHHWFKNSFLKAMVTIKNPATTIKLLKLCSKEDYGSIVRGIINYYITCPKGDRSYLQETMSLIINDPYRHDHYDDRSRQKIVDRIVHQIFLRLGNCDLLEKESIMGIFVEWYEWKDINLRRTLQQMFNAQEGPITAKNMLLILEDSVDLHWQKEAYNVLFIKLMLNIFYNKAEYMFNHLVRMVEMLCFKALASQVELCLPYIVKVIQKYADKNIPAVKPLLGILTHFALIPTQTGKKFLFEIHNLIRSAMIRNHDANVEFGVLGILISPDLQGKEIFLALETYFPISQEQLMVLLEERILKHRKVAWPFLAMLLDRYELPTFPAHFTHFLLELDNVEFYARSEAVYVLNAINKIFTSKSRKNILPEDKALAARLLNIFSKHIMMCIVPIRVANEVAMLISLLCQIIRYDCPKLVKWKQEALLEVINNYDHFNTFLIVRKLTYLSYFLIPAKMEIEIDDREKIRDILVYDSRDIVPSVLVKFITFYGKISLKFNYKIDQTITILKKFLCHVNPEVQIGTLATLYDISSFRLHSFKVLDSELLKLVVSKNPAIQDAALKLLLELLSKDQLRLNLEGTIIFLLAVVDRNINVDMFLKDPSEKEQLIKSEKVIKNYFVHLVFYLNEFTEQNNFYVTIPLDRTYTYEHRCVVYRHLFEILQRPDQLYILQILCIEFLQPLYNGVMELNFKSLMTLRDCLTLVSYYAAENIKNPILNAEEFYEAYMPKVESLLVSNNDVKNVVTKFNKELGIVVSSLLKMLCKIEKASKEMLPQIYNTIALITTAYYDNVLSIVNNDNKIRDLFCVYHTFFLKYRNIITSEPISAKMVADQEEWQQYIQSDI